LYRIEPTIANLIKSSMSKWRTKICLPHSNGTIKLDEVNIETGIFQRDSFSPLLFCLALNPLSNILKRANIGFKLRKTVVSYLLYMEDLKPFAKKKREAMLICKELVKRFSDDINMELGLDKCAVLHIKKGNVVDSMLLSDFPSLGIDVAYKNLGITEASDVLHTEIKTKATKEFI